MRKQSKSDTLFIGITPDWSTSQSPSAREEPIIFLSDRYTQAILKAGGIPIVLPIHSSRRAIQKALESLDGILVTGGNFDIHPTIYGEEPLEGLGQVKEERTQFELELISLSLERDLPLLGVCGGEQAINVALGGSLYQDIATQVPFVIEHQQRTPKDQKGHQIKLHQGTKLKQIVGCETLGVNTTHHQAVKKLGKGLITNASSEDGIVEGIESNNHSFVLGVQWHPEFLIDKDSAQLRIFSTFTSIAGKKLRGSENFNPSQLRPTLSRRKPGTQSL